ncbi:MAG: PH domain-containing protein [bacterium]|nr:PH domain-containing protein [bacterium]
MHLPVARNNNTLTSAFLVQPRSIIFNDQHEGEQLYLLIRKHQITNIPWVVGVFVLLSAPLLLQGLIVYFAPSLYENMPMLLRFSMFAFWYLLVIAYAFEQFLVWFFTVNIITNDRIIDVDFIGLINKNFAEAQFSKIQDVRSEVKGPVQLTFNYGDVYVQTAAEMTNIEFDDIPTPDQVSRLVGELVAEHGGSINRKES